MLCELVSSPAHTPQPPKHMVYVGDTKQDQPLKDPRSSTPPPAYVYTQQQTVTRRPTYPPGDQFLMSLFTVFCCFMPLGIVALIKSVEVSRGDTSFIRRCDMIVFRCRHVKPTRMDILRMLLLQLVLPKPSTSGLSWSM